MPTPPGLKGTKEQKVRMFLVRLQGSKRAPTYQTFLNAVNTFGLDHPVIAHLISLMSVKVLGKLRQSKGLKILVKP